MDRVKTGIRGLDNLTNGGIPKGHTILISGQAGAGKTILGLQYLVNGALKNKERGILLSFEESETELITQADTLQMDLIALQEEGLLKILEFNPNKEHLKTIQDRIHDSIISFKPKRLVFDSISTYGVYAETLTFFEMLIDYGVKKDNINFSAPESVLRRAVMDIMDKIKSYGITSFVISELPETSNYLSRDTISEFISDGVILLKHIPIGDTLNRSIEIRKMRQCSMIEGAHSYNITKKGIEIEV